MSKSTKWVELVPNVTAASNYRQFKEYEVNTFTGEKMRPTGRYAVRVYTSDATTLTGYQTYVCGDDNGRV